MFKQNYWTKLVYKWFKKIEDLKHVCKVSKSNRALNRKEHKRNINKNKVHSIFQKILEALIRSQIFHYSIFLELKPQF